MKPILKFSVLLMLLLACKRDKVNYIGPNYIAAPDGFAVTSFTSSVTSINYTAIGTKVTFNATFTHEVSWMMSIKGQTSNAVKEFSGLGDTISNLDWMGDHSGVEFFREGETAIATLHFYNSDVNDTIAIKLIKVPDYRFTCNKIYPRYGNFETTYLTARANWLGYDDDKPYLNIEHGIGTEEIDYNGNVVPSVQGNSYAYIRGTGAEPSFVSGRECIGSFQPSNNSPFPNYSFPSNPEDLWFNIYIYGTGDDNAQVNIEIHEEDQDGTKSGYTATDDDAFIAQVNMNYKGWKLHSFKYTDLLPGENRRFGGNGNRIHESDKIKGFVVILLKKYDSNKPVEVYFDFPTFTKGGPFVPCR